MKLLHTADWHLGKKLGLKERTDDHLGFFDWLLDTIERLGVEVLVVAGDVFDSGNPSNSTLKLYYDFLWRATRTCCRHVVVIGGNHDSVGTLQAPRDLLRHFNVHVVGGAMEDAAQQLIPVTGSSGEVELLVCAVPFLRDRDVKLSVSGETAEERLERIRDGIQQHYARLVPLAEPFRRRGVPVVATGHLFAAGALATPDSEKEVHVGNLGQVGAEAFPMEFDYVALGHLHRAQTVNGMRHIRYSGSPIALSFSEHDDPKRVVVADFGPGGLLGLDEVRVPAFRRLARVRGTLERLTQRLPQLARETDPGMSVWLEVQVETAGPVFDLEERLGLLLRDHPNMEVLFVKQLRSAGRLGISQMEDESVTLHDLSPMEVFERKCASEFPDEDCGELMLTFAESLELMREREE